MAVSQKALFVPGVWGPYYSAMVPGLWLSEGGQSATGRLLDHVIQSHPASPSITANTSKYVWTNSICILNHFFFFNLYSFPPHATLFVNKSNFRVVGSHGRQFTSLASIWKSFLAYFNLVFCKALVWVRSLCRMRSYCGVFIRKRSVKSLVSAL